MTNITRLKKIKIPSTRGIKRTDNLEVLFIGTIDEVNYYKNIDEIPIYLEHLLETYNKDNFWFAFELCIYLISDIDDMIRNRKIINKEDLSKYKKNLSYLMKICSMDMKPHKKIEIPKRVLEIAYFARCYFKKDFLEA